jgi:hypothetical protein
MNALADLIKRHLGLKLADMNEQMWVSHCQSRNREPSLAVYCREITTAAKSIFDAHSIAWQTTKDSILKARNIARQRGAEFMVLLYHQRDFIYYEKVIGEPPPSSHYEFMASQTMKDFCQQNGIALIDTYGPLTTYLNGLAQPVALTSLPFFRRDGHMNEIGQRLVAQTVLDYIESRQHSEYAKK